MKRNISAFSDNLSDYGKMNDALLTAIKNVDKYCEQVISEISYKNFMLVGVLEPGFTERQSIWLITSSFEPHKFLDVSRRIKNILQEDSTNVNTLIQLKIKRSLMPYSSCIEKLALFSENKILIDNDVLEFKVCLMKSDGNGNYSCEMEIRK